MKTKISNGTKIILLLASFFCFSNSGLIYGKTKYVITIDKFSEKKVPIAIMPFVDRSDPPFRHADWNGLATIITSDLSLTGWFEVIKPEAFLDLAKTEAENLDVGAIAFQKWAAIDADYLVKGTYEIKGKTASVKMVLYDVVARKELRVFSPTVPNPNESGRKTAHKIANHIVEEITGEMGIFDTYIAGTFKAATKSAAKQIFYFEIDGSRMQTLTRGNNIKMFPAWNRDGTKLAYTKKLNSAWELFIIDFAARKHTQITSLEISLLGPVWSPIEDRIVIPMSKDDDIKIFSMSATGKILRQITKGWNTMDAAPSFSPDGTRIAYMSGRTGTTQIYVIDADGNNNRRLTFNDRSNETPSWSPKGDKIAFASRDRDGYLDIFVTDVDGNSEPGRLTYDTKNNEDPSWSPDGRFIAFSSDRSGTSHLYRMNKDGSNLAKLTDGTGNYENPAWSPRLK